MRRILLELTDELATVLDSVIADRKRNATIEDWLWGVRPVRDAAKRLDVTRRPRPGLGRPPPIE